MPRVLRKLRVDFGSLVDVPANQHAHVVLFKRHIEKRIVEDNGEFIVYSHSGKVLGRHKTRAEALAQLRAVEANKEKRMGDEQHDDTAARQEAIAKRMEELEKRLADAEKSREEALTIAKNEREARLTAEYIRKAEAFAHLAIKPAVLGAILRKVAEVCEPAEVQAIDELLNAANAAAAPAFREAGKGGEESGNTATERLDKLAKALVTEKKATDYAAAIGQIATDRQHTELYSQYRAEQLRGN